MTIAPPSFLPPGAPLPVDLPRAVLEHPVRGRKLRGATLADELGPRATALVFLRHFG